MANPGQSSVPEVKHTANFSFNQLLPWVVAPSPFASSTGAATVSAVVTDAGTALNSTLQTVNRLGPLTFDLDSWRSFSASGPPPGSTAGTANYTQMDQWVFGIAGLASSTGAVGFTDNAVSYDPYIATHAGVLQTANRLGPFVFNLNVLKAIGFTQAPTGQVGVNGQPDNFSSVDIGRWTAGIPGVITNSGTVGFVTYQDFANGPVYDYRVAGLHTRTQIGSLSFDFNFLPYISTGILLPPRLSFGLSQDMTAANTPFAQFTPPPPGVVLPFGGLPVPPPFAPPPPPTSTPTVLAESVPTASAAAPETATPETATPEAETLEGATLEGAELEGAALEGATPETPEATDDTPEATDEESAIEIPGVNGAPLVELPTTATSRSGGGNPFTPFKPFTDAISNGIGALTGNRPAAPGGTASSGSPDTGDGPSPGSESAGDTGSEAG